MRYWYDNFRQNYSYIIYYTFFSLIFCITIHLSQVNPTITNDELVNWCKERGVIVMAYSPFGGMLGRKNDAPPPRADHPILVKLAAKYRKTVPQILLRYLVSVKFKFKERVILLKGFMMF